MKALLSVLIGASIAMAAPFADAQEHCSDAVYEALGKFLKVKNFSSRYGDVDDSGKVAALCTTPADAIAGYVFAHGAGAGMDHPFMAALSGEGRLVLNPAASPFDEAMRSVRRQLAAAAA